MKLFTRLHCLLVCLLGAHAMLFTHERVEKIFGADVLTAVNDQNMDENDTRLPGNVCHACLKRGKRGKRGHRGHKGTAGAAGLAGTNGVTGATGATGPAGIGETGPAGTNGVAGATGATGAPGVVICGRGEIWANSLQMYSIGEGYNEVQELMPYGEFSPYIPAWFFEPSTENPYLGAGLTFDVPIDLDNTQPVNVVLHFLVGVPDGETTGNQAAILVNADYRSSGQLLGIFPPATGFADIQTSSDFTITEPTTNGDFIQISISIPLNPAVITGDWGYLAFARVAPASNEYSGMIALATVSLQYSRICNAG